MKPKDKAEKLFYDYLTYFPEFRNDLEYDYNVKSAKNCALIAVDELIYETQFEVPNIRQRYWINVKQEIIEL